MQMITADTYCIPCLLIFILENEKRSMRFMRGEIVSPVPQLIMSFILRWDLQTPLIRIVPQLAINTLTIVALIIGSQIMRKCIWLYYPAYNESLNYNAYHDVYEIYS